MLISTCIARPLCMKVSAQYIEEIVTGFAASQRRLCLRVASCLSDTSGRCTRAAASTACRLCAIQSTSQTGVMVLLSVHSFIHYTPSNPQIRCVAADLPPGKTCSLQGSQ